MINKDRYEGGWENNMRNGQGTLWINDGKKKLRREYTGDWINDKRTGRGTMFYQNGDRYDGFWVDDQPHGSGRMINENGDVYEGFWCLGKRSGYGVMTKKNGDHFEGHWVNDKREGQGSYFFNLKNQVFVGEWVEDIPKTGVYSGVEDPENPSPQREQHYHQPYILPPFPEIKLNDPTGVLQSAMEKVRQERTFYRASFIPINELYEEEQLNDLAKEFSAAENELHLINMINLQAILANMNFELVEEEIESYLSKLNQNYNPDEIDFELFARLVAILLEEVNNLQRPDQQSEKNLQEQQLQSQQQQFSQENKYFDESDSYFDKFDQQINQNHTEQNEIDNKFTENKDEEEEDQEQNFDDDELAESQEQD